MKKTFLFSALLLAAFSMKAQNCHYDTDDTDPITGKAAKTINCKLAKSWRMVFAKQDKATTISVYMILPGDQRMRISKGDSVIIKLENQDVITLYASAEAVPTAFVAGSGSYRQVLSSYLPVYPCDAEKMKQLSASPIEAMRFYFGDTPVTLPEVKGKSAEKIQTAATCIQM